MQPVVGYIMGLIVAFLFAFVSVEEKDIIAFQKVCEKNEGIKKIRLDVIGDGQATCKDGARFSLKDKQ